MEWKVYLPQSLGRIGQSGVKEVPVSDNQDRYIMAERFTDATYSIGTAHKIVGVIDKSKIISSINAVFIRHEILRSSFVIKNGSYVARIHSDVDYHFIELISESTDFEVIRKLVSPQLFTPVEFENRKTLYKVVIVNCGPEFSYLCLSLHHCCTDGFSRNRFFSDFVEIYSGVSLPLVESYYSLINQLSPETLRDHEEHWIDVGNSLKQSKILSPDFREKSNEIPTCEIVEINTNIVSQDFDLITNGNDVSKFGAKVAAYTIVLSRIVDADNISICFQSSGRRTLGVGNDSIGPFSNTLPLFLDIDLNESFQELAAVATERLRKTVLNEGTSFDKIVELTNAKPQFAINSYPTHEEIIKNGIVFGAIELFERHTEFLFNLVVTERRNERIARIFFSPQSFRKNKVAEILSQFCRVLKLGLHDPSLNLKQILVGSRNRSLDRSINRDANKSNNLNQGSCNSGDITERFRYHVRATPAAQALIWGGRSIDYRSLYDHVMALVMELRKCQSTTVNCVAIIGEREPSYIIAVLACLIENIAFGVIDNDQPKNRKEEQLNTLNVDQVLITSRRSDTSFLDEKVPTLDVCYPLRISTGFDPSEFYSEKKSHKVAYYLFTSGTTGKQQCYGHPAEALLRWVSWEKQYLDVKPTDRFSLLSGLAHDPVLRDIMVPLSSGAAVVVPSQDAIRNPKELWQFLDSNNVNYMHTTPALGKALLAYSDKTSTLPNVKAVLWGGEMLSGELIAQYKKVTPYAKQINMYGCTESPQVALIADVSDCGNMISAPAGEAPPWLEVLVMDDTGLRCGVEEVGELKIHMPYSVCKLAPTTREITTFDVHRTGDRGYMDFDGRIYLKGRLDDQINLRGNRIELSDVNLTLLEISEINQVETLLIEDQNIQKLVCFYTLDKNSHEFSESDIRQYAQKHLPTYTNIDHFCQIDDFPLLANGKVDKNILQNKNYFKTNYKSASELDSRFTPPVTAAERKICEIIKKNGAPEFKYREQSLSDVGVDSLSSISIRLKLETDFAELPKNWIYLSLKDLALSVRRSKDKTIAEFLRTFSEIETFIVLRSLMIFFVVAFHFDYFSIGARSTDILLLIVGYAFALLQLDSILALGSTRQIWKLILRIVVTIVPVTVVIVGWEILQKTDSHPSTVLMYANLLTYDTPPYSDGRHGWLWYIHTYLHIFLLLAIVLSISKVREQLRENTFTFLMATYFIATLVSHGTRVFFTGDIVHSHIDAMTYFWPTTHLPTVILGAMLVFASDQKKIMIMVVLVAFHSTSLYVGFGSASGWLITIVSLLLIYVPYMKLPAMFARLSIAIASASLFIYLVHMPLLVLSTHLTSARIPPSVLTIGAVAISMGLWSIWKPILFRIDNLIIRPRA